MQLLAGSNIITVDQSNKEDRQLFQGAQKCKLTHCAVMVQLCFFYCVVRVVTRLR